MGPGPAPRSRGAYPHLSCSIASPFRLAAFGLHSWHTALSCFLTRKRTPQKTTPTIREVVGWIAKLGGHLGRNADRAPGTQVLWEGIQRADDNIETTKLFTNFDHGP